VQKMHREKGGKFGGKWILHAIELFHPTTHFISSMINVHIDYPTFYIFIKHTKIKRAI